MNKTIDRIKTQLFELDRWKKQLIQLLFDSISISASFLLSVVIAHETIAATLFEDTWVNFAIAFSTTLLVYFHRGLYNSFTRHLSRETVLCIASASFVSTFCLLISTISLNLNVPLSAAYLFGLLSLISAICIRFFINDIGKNLSRRKKTSVAIYGVNAATIQLMQVLKISSEYEPVIFIVDDPKLHGKRLGGIPIETLEGAENNFEYYNFDILLMPEANEATKTKQKVLDIISKHTLEIKSIPNVLRFISSGAELLDLENMDIEQLLGREPIKPQASLMAKNITDQTVMVTGSGGSIGSELCRQVILWAPKRLILVEVSEYAIYRLLEELKSQPTDVEIIPIIGSVQSKALIKSILEKFAVDTIYHAAAYKHVPLMELNIAECVKNNLFGTINLAEMSITSGVGNFVLISTDKAVNPTSFMGASKRLAELAVHNFQEKKTNTRFSIVRFGNVLGSSGSVAPLFKKQIDRGGPVNVTHKDVTRYFMTIPEAAQLVIQAGSIASGGEIFVLEMGTPLKIIDLAEKMIRLAGFKPTRDPVTKLDEGEIAIKIIGLRPGEKMFEELAYGDNLNRTINPRIMTSLEPRPELVMTRKLLDEIREAVNAGDTELLINKIKIIAKNVANLDQSGDILH